MNLRNIVLSTAAVGTSALMVAALPLSARAESKTDISGAQVEVWNNMTTEGESLLEIRSVTLGGRAIEGDEMVSLGIGEPRIKSMSYHWDFSRQATDGVLSVRAEVGEQDQNFTGSALGIYRVREGHYDNRDFSEKPYLGIHVQRSSYEYAGKALEPEIEFFDDTYSQIEGSKEYPAPVLGRDYTVSYGGNDGVGRATATVLGSGRDHWTGSWELGFTINPPRAKVSKLAAGRKSASIRLGKLSGKLRAEVDGYQVNCSGKTRKFNGSSRKTLKIGGLKTGKRYSFKVRTYKRADGATYYSPYSKVRHLKAK